MPMQCYTCPEEEQCFFLTDVDHVSFEKANETRQNNLQSATMSLQVVRQIVALFFTYMLYGKFVDFIKI